MLGRAIAARRLPELPATPRGRLQPRAASDSKQKNPEEATSCGRRGSTPRAINSGSTLSVACVATLPSSSSLGDCEECGASSALGTAVVVEGGGIKTKTGANYRALRPARLSPVLSARAPGAELNQGAHQTSAIEPARKKMSGEAGAAAKRQPEEEGGAARKRQRGGGGVAAEPGNGAPKKQRSKCPHQRERNKCKECGGAGICQHQRQRHRCKECGGSSICPHQRIWSQCIECGGASICSHLHEYIYMCICICIYTYT